MKKMKTVFDMWSGKEMTVYENAREAFRAGKPYCPKIYGIGSRAQEPCEEGSVLSQSGKTLFLVDYMPAGYADGIPYGRKVVVLGRKVVG
jgi:hypothetical protein